MCSQPSKISGAFIKAKGSAKEAIGSATSNSGMLVQGTQEKAQGNHEMHAANADSEGRDNAQMANDQGNADSAKIPNV
ncbi:hypothetical protein DSO57_1031451 [Entomophthora muscae]|uniref:Uncharacterized protein n=1 Tax=Entomophthora muscae TaxID=34485 RepID=A0ACC2UKP1_9FUNG|nr:hypothetical protein DSO57_1031451 [Entomophthora muscae]